MGTGRGFSHRLHPAQHRKNLRERRRIARNEGFGLAPGQPPQVPAERVDERVNRLVRNRLLFVAPAGQDDRLVALEQRLQESLNERALADPRAAVNKHGHRTSLAHILERRIQGGKLRLTPHEQPALRGHP